MYFIEAPGIVVVASGSFVEENDVVEAPRGLVPYLRRPVICFVQCAEEQSPMDSRHNIQDDAHQHHA